MRPLSAGRVPEPLRVLSWLYVGRISLGIAVLVAALVAWETAPPGTTLSASLVLLVAGTFTAASFAYTRAAPRPLGKNFLYGQALFDAALVTWVVYLTGGKESGFAPLYILVICAAGLLLPMLGGILVGLLASILYFAVIVLSGEALDAAVILQIALFATVALVTGYLGDRLRQTGAVLGEIETELRLLRLDTADILGSMNTGILTVDGLGRLAYINPAAAELLALPGNRWLGRAILETLDAKAPGLGAVIRRSMEGQIAIRRSETEEREEGGTILGVSTTVMERPGPDGPTVTAIFQDITERKRMDALRLRAERLEAVAELSASLAHEIKNPLASIRSAVEQLTGNGVEPDDKRVLEGLVVRESDRLSRLLAEFIDFARVRVRDEGRVDLGRVVRHATEVVRQHPDARDGTAVELEVAGPVQVEGDEDLLHRVVFNLALNAVQHSPDGWPVEVELDPVGQGDLPPGAAFSAGARLRVRDHGPGIGEEDVSRVFDPFFTTRKGGSGLGLALVHRAVEAHGGIILIDSEPGRGTEFSVYLPARLRQVAS